MGHRIPRLRCRTVPPVWLRPRLLRGVSRKTRLRSRGVCHGFGGWVSRARRRDLWRMLQLASRRANELPTSPPGPLSNKQRRGGAQRARSFPMIVDGGFIRRFPPRAAVPHNRRGGFHSAEVLCARNGLRRQGAAAPKTESVARTKNPSPNGEGQGVRWVARVRIARVRSGASKSRSTASSSSPRRLERGTGVRHALPRPHPLFPLLSARFCVPTVPRAHASPRVPAHPTLTPNGDSAQSVCATVSTMPRAYWPATGASPGMGNALRNS